METIRIKKPLTIGKDLQLAKLYIPLFNIMIKELADTDMKLLATDWRDEDGFKVGEIIYEMAAKIKSLCDLVCGLFPSSLIDHAELPKKIVIPYRSNRYVMKDPRNVLPELISSVKRVQEKFESTIDEMDIDLGENVHYQEINEEIYNLYKEVNGIAGRAVAKLNTMQKYISGYGSKKYLENSQKITLTIKQLRELVEEAVNQGELKNASEQLKAITKLANAARKQLDTVAANPKNLKKKALQDIANNALKSISAIRTTIDKTRQGTRNAFGIETPKKIKRAEQPNDGDVAEQPGQELQVQDPQADATQAQEPQADAGATQTTQGEEGNAENPEQNQEQKQDPNMEKIQPTIQKGLQRIASYIHIFNRSLSEINWIWGGKQGQIVGSYLYSSMEQTMQLVNTYLELFPDLASSVKFEQLVQFNPTATSLPNANFLNSKISQLAKQANGLVQTIDSLNQSFGVVCTDENKLSELKKLRNAVSTNLNHAYMGCRQAVTSLGKV